MKMKEKLNGILVTLIFLAFFAGCSDTKNNVGIPSNYKADTLRVYSDSLFVYQYSLEDSVANFINSTKLIAGDYRNNNSVILMKFGVFPQDEFLIENSGAELSLQIKQKENTDLSEIKFGLVKQNWDSYQATWLKADNDNLWEASWDDITANLITDVQHTTTVTDSTVSFIFTKETMQEIIDEWINYDLDNEIIPAHYGFAVYLENSSDFYAEFYSRSTDKGPKLTFDYKSIEELREDEVLSYERVAMSNTFINSKMPQNDGTLNHQLLLANIAPTLSVIKFDTDNLKESLKNQTGKDVNIGMVTINKAELVLSLDETNSHFSEQSFGIYSYYLLEEKEYELNQEIKSSDLGVLSPNYLATLNSDESTVAINITSLVQAFISDIKTNNGIVLKSSKESFDNSFVRFHNQNAADAAKRPFLKLIYTTPILEK